MQTYETLFITPPTLAEDDEQTIVASLASVITDAGGTIHANDRMGRRRLAYPIEKHEDGVYTRFLYESDSAVPKELERRFRLSDKVLRGLTVRLEREWADDAKKQAVLAAERRVAEEAQAKLDAVAQAKAEAEAQAKAEAEAATAPPAEEPAAADATADAAKADTDAEPSA